MPASFNYPRNTEIWIPLDMSPVNLGPRGSHSYLAIGRLKPGVSVSQAQADLAVIAARLEKQFPQSNDKVGAAAVSMHELFARAAREPLLILLGAVAIVLLVACSNVANLLLIRAGARRREIAVRLALGASRWRLIRQLLIESVLLAAAGAAAGLLVALWCVKALQSVKSLPITLPNPAQIDVNVLLFTLAVAVVTGLLFGIAPAFQATGIGPSEELKAGSRSVLGFGRRGGRLRDAIAVVELAASVALLVSAGLLLRTFDRMRHAEIGVDTRNIVVMGINLPRPSYATPAERRQFFARLLEGLRAVPGIESASFSTQIPLEGGSNGYITVPGRDMGALRSQLFEWNYVGADYFRVFRIPTLRGRTFSTQEEDQAARVATRVSEVLSRPDPPPDALKDLAWTAVINRTMANLVWPGEDPIGRTFVIGGQLPVTVIGVVGDVRVRDVRRGALPQGYFPFPGALDDAYTRQLVVKTTVPPTTILDPIRTHVQALDPSLPLILPRTMNEVVWEAILRRPIARFLKQ
jgi:putative ABC transport system permease protein